jgi:PTH1 family peptidyl-tRNA hydrolase
MGLIQKRPYVISNVPAYTIGTTKSFLIIGLGNYGQQYIKTRHNIGFAAVEYFAQQNNFPNWTKKTDLKCLISDARVDNKRVILCKPITFMNLSGQAAQAAQRFYQITNKNTLAIYDELAIPFGQIRTRVGGSDAGHNGVKSLIQHLGDDFGRLRIGIKTDFADQTDKADYVLKKFSKKEQDRLPQILRESNAIISEFIFSEKLTCETRNVI